MHDPSEAICQRCGAQHTRCAGHNAAKRGGGPCGKWPRKGQRVCETHGGNAPHALAAARTRDDRALATKAATVWGIPRHIDPADGLMEEYWRSAGIVLALERVVRQIRDDDLVFGVVEVRQEGPNGGPSATHSQDQGGERGTDSTGSGTPTEAVEAATTIVRKVAPNVWIKLWNEERDRWAKLGIDIVRLGLEARRDEYIRAQVDVFAAVLLDPAMALTTQQRQTAGRLLRGLGAKPDVIDGQAVPA